MRGKFWRVPNLPLAIKPHWTRSRTKRGDPQCHVMHLPPDLVHHMPIRPFQLDEHIFSRNLRSSRRGAAAGPSGMTMEHLRPLLDDVRALHSFFLMVEQLAQANVPLAIVNLVRMGRLTALSESDGGVRGIVAGDVVRRLVARTISQQLAPAVERATSPHQYAMTTRAGWRMRGPRSSGLDRVGSRGNCHVH